MWPAFGFGQPSYGQPPLYCNTPNPCEKRLAELEKAYQNLQQKLKELEKSTLENNKTDELSQQMDRKFVQFKNDTLAAIGEATKTPAGLSEIKEQITRLETLLNKQAEQQVKYDDRAKNSAIRMCRRPWISWCICSTKGNNDPALMKARTSSAKRPDINRPWGPTLATRGSTAA